MNLERQLREWDGKSAEEIGLVYDQHHTSNTFVSEVLMLINDGALQNGATWLLKKHLDEGHSLDAASGRELFRLLPQLDHWEARLHILQCLPLMRIPARYKKRLESFLRECLEDENKFVRAWCYSGFHELARQHDEYQAEVRVLLAEASKTEAASVKARIRNLQKRTG